MLKLVPISKATYPAIRKGGANGLVSGDRDKSSFQKVYEKG